MREESCENCRYWEPCTGGDAVTTEAGDSGECRRHPPARILADAPDALASYAKRNGEYDAEHGEWEQARRLFPLTYCWDWCGEWRAKDEPTP